MEPQQERGTVTVMDASLDALRARIRVTGLRATSSRVAVLALLCEQCRPLTHGDVADLLADRGWDRATLYRNLMDLTEVGLVRRVAFGPSFRFEQASDGDGHAHFVCTECGSVRCTPQVKVPLSGPRGVPRCVRRGQVDVQLHGVCDDCE